MFQLADVDYEIWQSTSLFLTGADGEECVQVNIRDDNVVEGNETFPVNLTSLHPSVDISQSFADVSIIDDDTVMIQWSSTSYAFDEDSSTSSVCAELAGELARPVTVRYSTNDDSAQSNKLNYT